MEKAGGVMDVSRTSFSEVAPGGRQHSRSIPGREGVIDVTSAKPVSSGTPGAVQGGSREGGGLVNTKRDPKCLEVATCNFGGDIIREVALSNFWCECLRPRWHCKNAPFNEGRLATIWSPGAGAARRRLARPTRPRTPPAQRRGNPWANYML